MDITSLSSAASFDIVAYARTTSAVTIDIDKKKEKLVMQLSHYE